MKVAELEDCAGEAVNIRLIHAEVVEELVTVPDPCHVEVRSCVKATAMITDSRGIRSFVQVVSLSEVERARLLALPLVPPGTRFLVIQVHAPRPILAAAKCLLFSPFEIGMFPRA